MAFTSPRALGPIKPYLLTQCGVQVVAKPLVEQPHQDRIAGQAQHVADAFAHFVSAARTSLDICIYDFRLEIDRVRQTIVDAINGAAARGVTVRIAYDKSLEASDGPILKQFRTAGGDPAPVGTDHFLRDSAGLHQQVEAKAISEEAIDPGNQIMHQKYMVRDSAADGAAIWTGSTNFTVDAWALQENNILVISHCPELAAAYTRDFDELWTSGRIAGSGAGDIGTAVVADRAVRYAFAPGEGHAIEALIAEIVAGTTEQLRIASMVTSSQTILAAIKAQIDAGLDVGGTYDRGETENVRANWRRTGQTAKVALLDATTRPLVAKPSLPYSPQNAHNFMHDKLIVADHTVITGSFNFSLNATRNAENVLVFDDADLATLFTGYIEEVADRYRGSA
ncbi:phospholipase D-like domain-containing protein [Solirubrobacter soli]|uniref:phospholipase D-like domain-containing protein n=1 Tax=Solirubrobacter soli TaxID=363832 RepID=UPI0004182AAD|nr:phospholipase D-like domain-containing protein [Solirubrobacter soli]